MTGRNQSDKKQAVDKWKLTIQRLNYILLSKISFKCDENQQRAKVIEDKRKYFTFKIKFLLFHKQKTIISSQCLLCQCEV